MRSGVLRSNVDACNSWSFRGRIEGGLQMISTYPFILQNPYKGPDLKCAGVYIKSENLKIHQSTPDGVEEL